MRLLIVMTNYPFPPRTGSAIVAYNTIKYLSQRHLIDLVCLQTVEGIVEPAKFVWRNFIPQDLILTTKIYLIYFGPVVMKHTQQQFHQKKLIEKILKRCLKINFKIIILSIISSWVRKQSWKISGIKYNKRLRIIQKINMPIKIILALMLIMTKHISYAKEGYFAI